MREAWTDQILKIKAALEGGCMCREILMTNLLNAEHQRYAETQFFVLQSSFTQDFLAHWNKTIRSSFHPQFLEGATQLWAEAKWNICSGIQLFPVCNSGRRCYINSLKSTSEAWDSSMGQNQRGKRGICRALSFHRSTFRYVACVSWQVVAGTLISEKHLTQEVHL